MTTIQANHFTGALLVLLDETFDNVQGHYLDRGTSLFETLATISHEEASIPVGGQCATLAAQAKHTAFFLDFVAESARSGPPAQVDWGEIWRTVGAVTPEEWAAIQQELRASYERITALVKSAPAWPSEAQIRGAMAVVVHSAYHLGEIRQALCTLRPSP